MVGGGEILLRFVYVADMCTTINHYFSFFFYKFLKGVRGVNLFRGEGVSPESSPALRN